MRSGRRTKQGKVICPGSQYVGRSGAQTHNLAFYESCTVPLDHMCSEMITTVRRVEIFHFLIPCAPKITFTSQD